MRGLRLSDDRRHGGRTLNGAGVIGEWTPEGGLGLLHRRDRPGHPSLVASPGGHDESARSASPRHQ